MTNSTETFWDVDGVSLQTYAHNIATLGGDRMTPPAVRGSDQTIPFMPGTRWVPRVPNSRTITLGMWINGANEDGTAPTDLSARRKFDENWTSLRNLLFRSYRKQLTLTKRFWVDTADLEAAGADLTGVTTQGTKALYTASAKCSFASGLAPSMHGPARAAFTVDLLLSDPYFYSSPITKTLTYADGSASFPVLGDDRTHNITLAFKNILNAPRLNVVNDGEEVWAQHTGNLVANDVVSLDVRAFRARKGAANVISTVDHGGSEFWLYLDPGDVSIALVAGAGSSGSVDLTYQPAWL